MVLAEADETLTNIIANIKEAAELRGHILAAIPKHSLPSLPCDYIRDEDAFAQVQPLPVSALCQVIRSSTIEHLAV